MYLCARPRRRYRKKRFASWDLELTTGRRRSASSRA